MQKSAHAPKTWLPEHMPLGTQVCYKSVLNGGSAESYRTVEVTDLTYNGIDSFVFDSNSQCPIYPDDPTKFASANADYVVAIVKRVEGGLPFARKSREERQRRRKEYIERFSHGYLHRHKGRHQYVAYDRDSVIMQAIYSNDTLFAMMTDMNQRYRFSEAFYAQVADLFEYVGEYSLICRANKRKLVARLKRILPHYRISKAALLEEERRLDEEFYKRDMEHYFGDNSLYD